MPSVFSRFADIISSNINAMLDKAENPSKMIRLIIGEMEDTLVEIKAATAQAMAEHVHAKRRRNELQATMDMWLDRAKQAVGKNRDDLARIALVQKRELEEELKSQDFQISELEAILQKHREEIEQLDLKITQAREREKILALRQEQAEKSILVSGQMKRFDLASAQIKLGRLDQRLDRLEAEADLEKSLRRPISAEKSLEAQFEELDDSIELELKSLKA
ncbi:MAG: PspA/IM30 family protein [Deltaproteobacteria bacterium]|jgi:phage shock protein A|nr:PspA/IM30 family protein [Deltaproteobacteria bacterium]